MMLNQKKYRLHRCTEGVTFLGWRLFAGRERVVRENVTRFGRKMKRLQKDHAAGLVTLEEVGKSVQAWIAHASFGNTKVLRERVLERYAFGRGAGPWGAGGVVQQ